MAASQAAGSPSAPTRTLSSPDAAAAAPAAGGDGSGSCGGGNSSACKIVCGGVSGRHSTSRSSGSGTSTCGCCGRLVAFVESGLQPPGAGGVIAGDGHHEDDGGGDDDEDDDEDGSVLKDSSGGVTREVPRSFGGDSCTDGCFNQGALAGSSGRRHDACGCSLVITGTTAAGDHDAKGGAVVEGNDARGSMQCGPEVAPTTLATATRQDSLMSSVDLEIEFAGYEVGSTPSKVSDHKGPDLDDESFCGVCFEVCMQSVTMRDCGHRLCATCLRGIVVGAVAGAASLPTCPFCRGNIQGFDA